MQGGEVAAAVVGGTGLCVLGYAAAFAPDADAFWLASGVGLPCLLFAGALQWLSRRNRRLDPVATAAQLKVQVKDRPIPFSVCVRCRVVIELPFAIACPRCGVAHDCVAVSEESERSIAMAAIGSD